MVKQLSDEPGRSTLVLSFLIADVRGYTRFTAERGDAAAAHGVCGEDPPFERWFNQLGESVAHQGDELGAFHPNRLGHEQAYLPFISSVFDEMEVG